MTNENNYHDLWNPRPRERRPKRCSHNPPATSDNVITQDELRELIRLQQQRDLYTQAWNSIRQRLLAEAVVEPGARHVRIEEREVVSFSQRTLRRQFGVVWVEKLREIILPEIHRKMVIENQGVRDSLGE